MPSDRWTSNQHQIFFWSFYKLFIYVRLKDFRWVHKSPFEKRYHPDNWWSTWKTTKQVQQKSTDELPKKKSSRTEDREEAEHFNYPPRFITSDLEPVDSSLAMADHYVRFLGEKHKPTFFITLSSEKPCSEEVINQVYTLLIERWSQKTAQHNRTYSAWGLQPIRNLKGKQNKHAHKHGILSCEKELTRHNVRQWVKEMHRALAYVVSRSRKEKNRASKRTSRKNGENWVEPIYQDWKNLKLNIHIRRINAESNKAGLYTIQNHRDLVIHPVFCGHNENKCRSIVGELKNGKMVCKRRVCKFERTDETQPDTTPTESNNLLDSQDPSTD